MIRLIDKSILVTAACTECGKVHKEPLVLGAGKESDTYYGKVTCCGKEFVVSSRPKWMDVGVEERKQAPA